MDSLIGALPNEKENILASQDFATRHSKNLSQDYDSRPRASIPGSIARCNVKRSEVDLSGNKSPSIPHGRDNIKTSRNLNLSKPLLDTLIANIQSAQYKIPYSNTTKTQKQKYLNPRKQKNQATLNKNKSYNELVMNSSRNSVNQQRRATHKRSKKMNFDLI